MHSDPEALLRAGRAALATAAAAEGQAAKRHKAGLGQAVRFAQAVEVIVSDGQTEERGATADRAAGEVKRPEAVLIKEGPSLTCLRQWQTHGFLRGSWKTRLLHGSPCALSAKRTCATLAYSMKRAEAPAVLFALHKGGAD